MAHLSGKFIKVSSPEPHVLLVELSRYVSVQLVLGYSDHFTGLP